MLLQIKNLHFWMQAKMGQRGTALVEYAILLAFVAVVGVAFIGSGSGNIASHAENIIKKITSILSTADTQANPKPSGT